VTTWEPRWLEEDLAWARAHLRDRADRHTCGHPLSETTAMADGEPVNTYAVPPPIRCYACDAVEKEQERHEKLKVVRPGALLWQAVRD
jgi:hypothetical protein